MSSSKITEIKNLVASKQDKIISVSDAIWDYAETRFEETKSAAELIKALEAEGFTVEENVAGIETAFVGTYGSGSPVIGFLGEYDALAGLSQVAGEPHEKPLNPGKPGHGCGHNLLGAAAFGAAVALKDYIKNNNISGTIKYFGCPGEEGGSGKTYMARENVFSGTDIAFTWHPGAENTVFGTSSLANIQAYFRFKGKSAHAAGAPENGRSALDAVELMNVGSNYLREHVSSQARFHYAVTNTGGNAPNVVQAEAEVLYLVRAPQMKEAKSIYERVCNIARGAALMTETSLEIVFDKACSNYIPNVTLSKVMYENMLSFGPPEFDEEDIKFAEEVRKSLTEAELSNSKGAQVPYPDWKELDEENSRKPICDYIYPYHETMGSIVMSGSTDVGDASWVMPTAQIYITTVPKNTSAHTWQWVCAGKSPMAHKGLIKATEIMAGSAVDALLNPEIIKNAKAELDKVLSKTPYENPIPKGVNPKPMGK